MRRNIGLTVQGCTVKARLGMDASEDICCPKDQMLNVIAPTRPVQKLFRIG